MGCIRNLLSTFLLLRAYRKKSGQSFSYKNNILRDTRDYFRGHFKCLFPSHSACFSKVPPPFSKFSLKWNFDMKKRVFIHFKPVFSKKKIGSPRAGVILGFYLVGGGTQKFDWGPLLYIFLERGVTQNYWKKWV